MKIRKGFVSNSSSSSFVCEITGATESGYDMSYEDMGFACCTEGHVFLDRFILDDKNIKNEKNNADNDDDDDEDYERDQSDLDKRLCPICQLKEISKEDMIKYLFKIANKTEAEVKENIKKSFDNYESFTKFIK